MTILDEIVAHKRVELETARKERPADDLARAALSSDRTPAGFRRALQATTGASVIAEVKRRSPSKGLIREDFDPAWIAQCYAEAGAACVSVLTDEKFFGGSLDDLRSVRESIALPILRKDFVIEAYQIDEARVVGADAILLIVSILADGEMKGLRDHALSLGLDVLVEVHDESELDRALELEANLIGVNNRDLKTFSVDLATTERLAKRLSECGRGDDVVLVAESGIGNAEDVLRLERAGAAGFLVGESLMRQPHPGKALEALRRST